MIVRDARVVTVAEAEQFDFDRTREPIPRGRRGTVFCVLLGSPREVVVRWDGGSFQSRIRASCLRALDAVERLAELADDLG